MNKYRDRSDAGKVLSEHLTAYAHREDVIVLALPRGGVPVAFEIARALSLPFDVFVVRKLGVPGQEELAMGALATGNVTVFNDNIIQTLHVPKESIEAVIEEETKELHRRELAYRGNILPPDLKNKTIILVDDGIATGATIRAAIKALRTFHPTTIIVAVPVAEATTCQQLADVADKIICPFRPLYFSAVGEWFEDFSQTTDEEVHELLGGN